MNDKNSGRMTQTINRMKRVTPQDDIYTGKPRGPVARRKEVASIIRSMALEIERGNISSIELSWHGGNLITLNVDESAGNVTIEVDVE